jgi:predicted flap endonuclease-1-like 5' DNA nuclease
MSPFLTFVLGLLIGWLIEWIIDWVYWRRRWQVMKSDLDSCRESRTALEAELASLRSGGGRLAGDSDLRSVPGRGEPLPVSSVEVQAVDAGIRAPAVPPIPDDLEVIDGIGPVIARKLNDAGFYTFEQLAELTPDSLRNILGDMIKRLADEESLIKQARDLATSKRGREA